MIRLSITAVGVFCKPCGEICSLTRRPGCDRRPGKASCPLVC
ncbi:hypothetical protein HMPREF0201_02878 [Cedecea davisae DSM 4568]|uniref:Uncharacterized protein n=1 Tax=Cedecea davisae DSM 4568 TaxID=566551 RepID=S3JTP6_9ENTR|nr:hypothetical protein HMPREF0201_02878 [Cedecea davisae DSM 4568]